MRQITASAWRHKQAYGGVTRVKGVVVAFSPRNSAALLTQYPIVNCEVEQSAEYGLLLLHFVFRPAPLVQSKASDSLYIRRTRSGTLRVYVPVELYPQSMPLGEKWSGALKLFDDRVEVSLQAKPREASLGLKDAALDSQYAGRRPVRPTYMKTQEPS